MRTMTSTPPSDHTAPDHGAPGHVHDEACAAAHGELVLPADQRRLVLVFASPVAEQLQSLAERLGWPVSLVDPDTDRLGERPGVASIEQARLDADCDVVVCDHDRPDLGDVLAAALAGPVRWVGVMGSPRHTAPHVAALRERGLPDDQIARVHRPIGLDIGSKTPPEIAVATVAGLLADRNGRTGGTFG
jgi:xanthine/CO dehydrogenase XdhC/CoxF family maturation factor